MILLTVSSSSFTHLVLQNAIITPFRTHIPTISHFDLLELRPRPKKCEKCSKVSNIFIADSVFLGKNLVSPTQAVSINFFR